MEKAASHRFSIYNPKKKTPLTDEEVKQLMKEEAAS